MSNIYAAGKDCYELAKEWSLSPTEAAQRMISEGWKFNGYNENGDEVYLAPGEEVIKEEEVPCGGGER